MTGISALVYSDDWGISAHQSVMTGEFPYQYTPCQLLVSIQNLLVPFMDDLVPMRSFRLPLAGEHVQHSE